MSSETEITKSGVIRAEVTEALEPLIPAEWKFERGIATLDRTLSAPVLWLEYGNFEPFPGLNPAAGYVAAQMDICIATHLTDIRKAEAAIDDMVIDLYFALLQTAKFYAITATKTKFVDTYFGWRLTVTIGTNPKKIKPAPPAPTEE